MSCEGRAWLINQPGVLLCTHVFWFGLWTASSEITGEGGTPALFSAFKLVKMEADDEATWYRRAFARPAKCGGTIDVVPYGECVGHSGVHLHGFMAYPKVFQW